VLLGRDFDLEVVDAKSSVAGRRSRRRCMASLVLPRESRALRQVAVLQDMAACTINGPASPARRDSDPRLLLPRRLGGDGSSRSRPPPWLDNGGLPWPASRPEPTRSMGWHR